jgi:TolB-like protein
MKIPIPIRPTARMTVHGLRVSVVLSLVCLSLILPPQSGLQAQELAFSRAAEEAAGRLAEAFPMLRGVVVQVEGDRVLVDLGTKQKVYQGMELQVYREGDEVKHPVTGLVLGRRDKRLALVRVVEVKEGFSEAAVVTLEEGAAITTGDLVRVSHDRLTAALPLIDRGEFKSVDVQSVTKDLAIALAKTGRFYVIEDHLVRAALMGDAARIEPSSDPAVLKLLAEKARAQLLLLGRLTPAEQGAVLNIQVVSVSTGSPLTVASAEIAAQQLQALASPSLAPATALASKSAPAFVRVQPSTPSEQPKVSPREVASVQRAPVSGASQQKEAGVPSFLIKGSDPSGQSGDQGAKDHLTLDLADSLLAVAAGDLDGDRRAEIVGITDSEVIAYRWRDRQLTPVARIGAGESFIRLLHIDVADVNGTGSAQVFVTALSSVPEGLKLRNTLRSFVLELRGDRLVKIVDGLEYFLRVLTGPGIEAPILIAQRMGEQVPFEGPIVRLAWSGGRYVQGAPLQLPGQVKGLYDFAPVEAVGDQIVQVAMITEGRIRILGSNGAAPWEGKDDLGEVDHLAFYQTPELQAIRFKHGIRSGIPANPEEYADRSVLPRRVLVQSSPLWGDARAEILTLANSVKYGVQVSLPGGPPASGRVIAYDRFNGSFTRGWETVPIEGKVRDVAVVDLSGAGRRDLLVLSAVKEKGFAASLKDKSRGIMNIFSFNR